MKLLKPLKYLDVRNVYKDIFGENTPGKVIEKIRPLVQRRAKELMYEFMLAREKLKDIPGTNYQLGLHHIKNGNIDDAILRFKMVVYLAPEMAGAYYNLGRCLLMKGDVLTAEENLQKALSLKNDFPEVSYIIGKIKDPLSVESIPANIIAEHMQWRGEFLPEDLDLRGQRDKAVISAVLANIEDKNPNLEVLDIGCSQGGRGVLLRNKDVLKRIVGVDIYNKVTEKAANELFAGEAVYSKVSNAEISKYLVDNKEKFDVILAGNVFSYKGKLDGVFADIYKALKSGGILALIIAKQDVEEAFKLDIAKDKFTHSSEYFDEILKSSGFNIIDKKEKDFGNKKFNIIIAKMMSLKMF